LYDLVDYHTVVDMLVDYFGFEQKFIYKDSISEFYTQDAPIFRLVYDSSRKNIMISFNVVFSTYNAFQVSKFLEETVEDLVITHDYLMSREDKLLMGQEAYDELYEALKGSSIESELVEYDIGDSLYVYTIPHEIYSAGHPDGEKQAEELEMKNRLYGKFTWDDENE